MNPLKVLIVDDSAMMRKILNKMISDAPDMKVIGQASDPFEARDLLMAQIPDVMILDIEMPKMDGLTFLDKLMSHKPFPVLIFSGHAKTGSQVALKALELGAVDILEKPHDLMKGFESIKETILNKIRMASKSKVSLLRLQPNKKTPSPKIQSVDYDNSKIMAVASSTGGTEALKVFFSGFNGWVPPTVVVQHMPKGFTKTFAEHMSRLFSFEVKEAEEGDKVQENRVLIAPGDQHMEIVRQGLNYTVKLHQEPLLHGVRPAADYLMKSVAQCVGSRAVGVVLTGMGKDGAQGLLEMKNAGAYCVAQSEQTCVVYGMPAAAVQLGAVSKVLDLQDMAPHILSQLMRKKHTAA